MNMHFMSPESYLEAELRTFVDFPRFPTSTTAKDFADMLKEAAGLLEKHDLNGDALDFNNLAAEHYAYSDSDIREYVEKASSLAKAILDRKPA